METTNQHQWRKRRLIFLPLILIGLFSVSGILMLLWNWIIPSISTWSAVTYWQAMGLFVISRILFGGFQFRKHHRAIHRHVENHVPFKDRFMKMNDEERQQFKNQFKKHCCK